MENPSNQQLITDGVKTAATTPRYLMGAMIIVLLAFLPMGVETITVVKLTSALYFAMFVISWDFVSGYTNQVSFGHTFFYAIGGYTTTVLNLQHGVDPYLSIPAGVILAGVGGLLLAVPAIRVRGHYLALLTLMAPLILERLFSYFSGTFGGQTGLQQPETLVTGEDYVATLEVNYYLAYVLFVAIFLFAFVITRSDIGHVFKAIREDEDAVAASGINTTKFKLFAFVTSAMMGGLAGAFLVHSPVGSASPSQLLALVVMIDILIVSILSGLGTIVGPAFGGIALYMLRDHLSNMQETVPIIDTPVSDINLLAFYMITLALLFLLPGGLLPWSVRQGRRIQSIVRDRGRPLVTDGGEPMDDRTHGDSTTDGSNTEDERQ